MTIADRLAQVRDSIALAARQYKRDADAIELVVVSKNQGQEAILAAYRAGIRAFGENRVAEALAKQNLLPLDIQWHLIGTLQTNKAAKALNHFSLIHAVDSIDLFRLLNRKGSKSLPIQKVLLQVKVSDAEAAKRGMSPKEWLAHSDEIAEAQGNAMDICGVMAMAPLHAGEAIARRSFREARLFRDSLQERSGGHLCLRELSMGMSSDFPWAIAEGATMVRIGTAIFNG